MNESENKFTPANDSGAEDLRSEVQSLRASLAFSLILMFVFSFCVNVFLYRQAALLHGQAVQAEAAVNNFGNGSHFAEIWGKLNEFGRTHPDYAPVIARYNQFIHVNPGAAQPARK